MGLTGYRTIVVAVLMMISGIAANHGYHYDASILADAIIAAFGGVMIAMRAITKTPMGRKEDE